MNNAVQDIRDVRPPIDVPGIPWWLWVLLALFAVVAVCLFRYWQTHRTLKKVVVPKTSWEIAFERLTDLERQDLYGQGKVKEYFIALSDVIRRYIEDRFNIHAPEMTTEEFLNSVKANSFIAEKHKATLKEFLNLSDMVKFAKYGSNPYEARETLELARRFVHETKGEELTPPSKV